MATYDYYCSACGAARELHVPVDRADTDPGKRLFDRGLMFHDCAGGGVFKRSWRSVKFSGYRNEWVDPTTGESKTLTSERELKRVLGEQSARATDYTGIVHDFQPVDLADPAVAPHDDAGLKSQHDALVAKGEKQTRGRFVHTVSDGGN